MLGRPWKPYQRHIAEVAGELLPDGRYAYSVIVLTMPRQTGKTAIVYDVANGRARGYPDYRCRYSTHKGTITSDRFADWFLELQRHERIERHLKLRRSRGTEGILWRRQGSYFQAFPARDGALRSAALDQVVVDEAQEHDDVIGEALKRTITPTFSTRPRRQLWVVFTAGTDASTYAAAYLRKALAGAPGYALFDYGCPDDVDPLDRDLWHTWHPGLAYGLTDYAALDMALEEGAAAFVREYGNRWTRTIAGSLIPVEDWTAVQHRHRMPPGRLCLGVDVAADRGSAAIALAGPRHHAKILLARPGLDWAAERALELARRLSCPIAIDSVGPVATVKDELERRGAELLVTKAQDVANAAAGLLDAISERSCSLWPNTELDAAADAVTTRPLGDGGYAFSRRASAGPIAPLVAIAAALWGHDHLPPPLRKPVAMT
jgi:hypothetical protein